MHVSPPLQLPLLTIKVADVMLTYPKTNVRVSRTKKLFLIEFIFIYATVYLLNMRHIKDMEKMLAVTGIVVIVVAALAYSTFFWTSSADIEKNLKNLYELANPGTTAEIVTLTSQGNLFKVLVKLSSVNVNPSYVDVWITKDGKFLTQNVIFVKESVGQMQNLKEFVSCLYNKGVRIYGSLNQTTSPQGSQATLLQLNLLGSYSPAIYVSCDADLQGCLSAGITQVPTIVINNTGSVGAKDIAALEQLSGCKFD